MPLGNDLLVSEKTPPQFAISSQFSRQKLLTSKELLQIIFEFAPVAHFLFDTRGTIIEANKAAAELTGYAREEMIGRNTFELEILTREQARKVRHRFASAGSGKSVGHHEYDMKLRDGSRRILESNVFPIKIDGQTLILAMAVDVTARKISTENLRKQRAKLRSSQKELKYFSRRLICIREEERKNLSSVLHNEAGALAGLLKCRLNTVQKEIQAGQTSPALQGLDESLSLVNGHIAALKKCAMNLRPPDLDRLSLPEVLKNCYSDAAEKTGLKIVFRFGLNGHEIKNHASTIIYRIAQEALNNIIHHTEAKNVILSLACRDSVIRLKIADDGRGFHPDKKLKAKKLGLGILSMNEMAECVGGRFAIRSSPGKGTTVSVAIPVRNGVSRPERKAPPIL
ncbi:MAG: PAS domain S-box protein [Candidatus Aminicenantes bacterium]|nr:PAS domain S-box protein [Candidatus Aminicenantes bacterium]